MVFPLRLRRMCSAEVAAEMVSDQVIVIR
jgi:hypothetical protein